MSRVKTPMSDRMKIKIKHDHAAGDVQAVESGHREEARGEQADAGPEMAGRADAGGIVVADHQLVILVDLDRSGRRCRSGR